MHPMTRRTVLAGTAVTAAATVARPARASATPAIADIERRFDRRVGVYARNLRTGRELVHRPDERFAMCSTFKTLVVAAVLDGRLVSPDHRILGRPAHWPPSLVAGAGYAPRLQAWQDAGYVPTVAEVCEVTLADSDNAGGNWLLQAVGGPAAVTALVRSLGDRVTTLTRWEPDLNVWVPGQVADTTTPRAIGRSSAALLVGNALHPRARRRLVTWMRGNRTGDHALRRGLPEGWTAAEKTGSGDYGTRNDVGVMWTPAGVPVLISCLTRAEVVGAPTTDAPLAAVAEVVAARLG